MSFKYTVFAFTKYKYMYFNSQVSNVHYFLISEDSDDANMYLKLYKLAFGSVSLLPTENEVMLQVSYKITK